MASATLPSTAPVTDGAEEHPTPYLRLYGSSIIAVSVVFLVGVGVPLAFAMDSWSAGMGLGAFTALWGGPSFGFMAGSARVSAWWEKYHINEDD